MGIMDLFTIKSPEEEAEDSRRYDRWAFPYGEAQKEAVKELLRQLLPKEDLRTALAVYLIGREGYRGSYQKEERTDLRSREQRLQDANRALRRQLVGGRLRKLLPTYMAVILADLEVDEQLQYPSTEELRRRAQELEPALASLKK